MCEFGPVLTRVRFVADTRQLRQLVDQLSSRITADAAAATQQEATREAARGAAQKAMLERLESIVTRIQGNAVTTAP